MIHRRMALKVPSCLVALGLVAAFVGTVYAGHPEQVHLSFTGKSGEMHVSFVDISDCSEGTVQWGTSSSGLTDSAPASCELYTDGMKVPIAIYSAVMTDLLENQLYDYQVNVTDSGSAVFNFTAYPGVKQPGVGGAGKVYCIFADFGETNDVSLAALQAEAFAGTFDMIILPGDLAYDLSTTGGERGNAFMRDMEPILSRVPMAVAAGNHEHADNFSAYKARFPGNDLLAKASGSDSPMYYSFNDGLVHWIYFDTELYHYGGADRDSQIAWMRADLASVDRTTTPWIIASAHKCGTWMDEIGAKNWTELEDILDAGLVDLMYCGHVHNYQRILPQRHNVVEDDGCVVGNTYTDCTNIAYFVVGSPGCREKISTGKALHGVAKQVLAYGYGHLTVVNSTTLHWTWQQTGTQGEGYAFVPVQPGAEESDEAWIVKSGNRRR